MKNIIFGLDGVLADTLPFCVQTLRAILDENAVSYDPREIEHALVALDRPGQIALLADQFGVRTDVNAVNARCNAAYCETAGTKDSVADTLPELKKADCAVYVVSATPRPAAEACLKRLGFSGFLNGVWSYEDFGAEKADAGLFRAVAEKLGAPAGECIFADACVATLQAAKSAGMKVIGVYDGCTATWNGAIKAFADDYIYRLKEILQIVGGQEFQTVNEYIEFNWDNVIRECPEDGDQIIGIPYPFTVPAVGKFETLYYWDTYFTNVGLMLCGREALAKNNTDNMLYLVEKLGFMPNSTGTYHLDHSQPPFLSVMVRETYEYYKDKTWLAGAYKTLCKEYEFWMTQRSTPIGLNRYDTNLTDREYLATRAPDYEERVHLKIPGDRAQIGRHYLGVCESGHDCTSRFQFDIYDYAPVCLNSLLYGMELNMAYFANELGKPQEEAELWISRAAARKERMETYLLDENGCFRDYNYVTGKLSNDFPCDSVLPLFVGLAEQKNAEAFLAQFDKLEAEYGVLANAKNNFAGSYQWGYPNGWAPQQMMVIAAFDRYGFKTEAARIAKKYILLIDRVFEATHKLWEKYNVVEGNCDVEDECHGGMPPMMGWTAGIYLYAQEYLRREGNQ